MGAAQGEAAADEEDVAAAVMGDDAAGTRRREDCAGIDRRHAGIAGQSECASARQ